jgi:hypothetical protein
MQPSSQLQRGWHIVKAGAKHFQSPMPDVILFVTSVFIVSVPDKFQRMNLKTQGNETSGTS